MFVSKEFIHTWEVLIGSALGPFLAIILSAIGFLIKEKWQKKENLKEALRRTEIGLTDTLNQTETSISQLEYFVDRVEAIIKEIKEIKDEGMYAINETNFPPTINIYFDEELKRLKFKSYYLHNKILSVGFIVKWVNSTINQFRKDFVNLVRKNEFLVTMKIDPKTQRTNYLDTLEGFIKMVKEFLGTLKTDHTELMAQARIYNRKLIKEYFWTLWKNEGESFKYFRNNKAILEYRRGDQIIDRIDKLIAPEVMQLISKAKAKDSERSKK